MKISSVIATVCSTVSAVETVVNLGYATYSGRVVGDGTTQWLGMRYAAPPLADLRFKAPIDPPTTKGVQDASKFGNICIAQSPDDWTNKPSKRFTVGEDCLFVNVFAPSNATETSKLPVMFFIQGGGFTSNSNANYNGSDLARIGNMVVVSINYRVGPWGFLGGEAVETVDTNNGIRDMIKALEWAKEYVERFGGNPEHIVLNGDSAGAMAIVILMGAPAVQGRELFKGVIAESAGTIQMKSREQVQAQFDCLAKATGCASTSQVSTLECLRGVNATALQTTTCQFAPTQDKSILPTPLFHSKTYTQTLRRLPTIFGNTANEGTDFAPKTVNSTSDFRAFVASLAPFLSQSALDALVTMYASGDQPSFPNAGRYYRAASNALGELAFKCPSRIYEGNFSWIYNWAVPDPEAEASGKGAHHTVELHAIWGPNNTDGNPPKSYLPGAANEGVVRLMQGYVTSFVRSLDPSVGKVEGAPKWEKGVDGQTLRVGGIEGAVMGSINQAEGEGFEERCRRLRPVIEALEVTPANGTEVNLAD